MRAGGVRLGGPHPVPLTGGYVTHILSGQVGPPVRAIQTMKRLDRRPHVGRFLWYALLMAIRFTASASKHRIPDTDALHAMVNAEASAQIEGQPGEETRVFVGHPHPQTDRYIEVIVSQRGDDFVVFHVMPLSDLYRDLLQGRDP